MADEEKTQQEQRDDEQLRPEQQSTEERGRKTIEEGEEPEEGSDAPIMVSNPTPPGDGGKPGGTKNAPDDLGTREKGGDGSRESSPSEADENE